MAKSLVTGSDWQRMKKVEEINRKSTALLERVARRSTEWEKRRVGKRAAQVGADNSPEVIQARVKKTVETVNKFFDVLESRLQRGERVGEMAEADLQPRVDRLEEVAIVQAGIMDRLERKYDEAIRRHDQEMSELRAAQLKTEQSLQVLSAGVRALTETVDQFIKGSRSNGHKSRGKKR